MSNNITITVTGNIAGDPVYFEEKDDMRAFASLRIASTPRYFDRETNEWSDGNTTWFDVNSYGSLAKNIGKCLEKGQPIIVTGILRTRKWVDDEGTQRSNNLIKATSIGHNLSLGTAEFIRGKATDDEINEAIEAAQNDEIDGGKSSKK